MAFGWFKNGVSNLASSVKTAVSKTLAIPKDIVKQGVALLPHGKKIVEWVGKAVDNTLSLTQEYLIDKPMGLIHSFRDQFKEVIGKKIDERTLERGAHFDKFLAGILLSIVANYGAGPLQKLEQRPFAEHRAKISQKLKAAAGHLDRFPAEPGSDADLIKSEENFLHSYGQKIDEERNESLEELSEIDTTLIASSVGLINAQRAANGLEPLRITKKLSDAAFRRARFLKLHENEKPAPFSFLDVPPSKRQTFTRIVPATLENGKPRFDLSPEEEELLIEESVKNNGDGTYSMTFHESDASYARRIREARQRREAHQYDDFTLSMDHSEGDYPSNGDPHHFLEKMNRDPQIQQAVLGQKNGIGMGISHKGSKMFWSSLLMEEENPDPNEPLLTEPIGGMSNIDWFNKIPRDERGEDSLYYKLFYGEPGKPPFDSGLSLFQFYLLKKKVDELGKTHEIAIDKVDFHPQEEINNIPYDLLHISIQVNGAPQIIKLVKGTAFADVPEEGASKNDPQLKKSVGNFMHLDDYFQMIEKVPVPRHYSYLEKRSQQHEHPEVDTLTPPRVETPEEEDDTLLP